MSSSIHPKPTILSVDDSNVTRTFIQRSLKDDYQLLLADNAMDALDIISHKSIALLLLDVSMPEIDGLELCRTIRNLPRHSSLPIVLLTARDSVFDKAQGRMAGATDYLTKPFDAEQLNQIVERVMVASQKNERGSA